MSGVGFDQYGALFSNAGDIRKQPFAISERPKSQMHSRVAFNTLKSQFFVVYNSSESGSPDVKGVILDETALPLPMS